MRWLLGTFLLCAAVTLGLSLFASYRDTQAVARELKADRQPEHVSSFNEQLSLNPEMFNGAMPEDKAREAIDNPEMHGGVLGDALAVKALMFRKNQDRRPQQ